MFEVELLSKSTLSEAFDFLHLHEDFSLFLLSNLETYGPTLSSYPNSGNFKIIRSNGETIALFQLTRRGNLVIHSVSAESGILEKILFACEEEKLPIHGVVGEWSFCEKLWDFFKARGIIRKETFISKEILYMVKPVSLPGSPHVRLLKQEDFLQWKELQSAYIQEKNLPKDLSEEELRDEFLKKVSEQIAWGYFLEKRLVARAELNAKAKDLGQVGGVFTVVAHRKKGFARSVMQQLLKDSKELHHIRKLMIFTGETNYPARKLYESIEARSIGYYGLLFGK